MASEGDIRVLLVLDLVLSFLFSVIVVSALGFINVTEFTWRNVAAATLFLAVLTYLVVLR